MKMRNNRLINSKKICIPLEGLCFSSTRGVLGFASTLAGSAVEIVGATSSFLSSKGLESLPAAVSTFEILALKVSFVGGTGFSIGLSEMIGESGNTVLSDLKIEGSGFLYFKSKGLVPDCDRTKPDTNNRTNTQRLLNMGANLE